MIKLLIDIIIILAEFCYHLTIIVAMTMFVWKMCNGYELEISFSKPGPPWKPKPENAFPFGYTNAAKPGPGASDPRGRGYTEAQLEERVNLMSGSRLTFSNQYGMLFILNDEGQILLNISKLKKESNNK